MTDNKIIQDISEEIKFKNECFNYIVKYSSNHINEDEDPIQSINIKCSHDEEFYVWSFTTDKPLENVCSGSNNIVVTPDMLFEMFKDFKDGSLSEPWFFEFPITFKTFESSLTIKVVNKFKYSKNPDVKFIDLKPYFISEVQRCNFKFQRTNELMEQKYSTEIFELKNKLEVLETKLVKTKKKLSELKYYVNTECLTETDLEEGNISEEERERIFKDSFEKYLSKRENIAFFDKKLDEFQESFQADNSSTAVVTAST
ncbi:hypothetical protein QJ854_gp786 [Moumouvirus goulette]|uniref:Uncharacterized protein n=1 Tax=Moumouvirus goulette TaxID=1247379 RepID=M1PM47_9VIRU|nr:hypothetical protein QJ854_gp786 [Moumouvirus goulette]AGF84996.1 hypothetical protein glt_00187 [Moumouvirus goulette]